MEVTHRYNVRARPSGIEPEPSSKKQMKSNRLKSEAVQSSVGFSRAYNLTKTGIEDIKKRDKKTRRFKEPLVSAANADMNYNAEGKYHHGWDDNPWGGDLGKLEDAFDRYKADPNSGIVWEWERERASSNIDKTRDWYEEMRRSQWEIETEQNVPVRNFHYEQQIMEQLLAEKQTATIQGDYEIDTETLL